MIQDTVKPEIPPATKDISYMTIHEMTEEVYTITEDSWAIQIGAFRSKSYAEGFKDMLERELGKEVQITVAGDYYRVRILDLHTREEVDENIEKLNKLGFKELWIIRLLARQQQIVLVQKTDSLAIIKEIPLTAAEIAEMNLNAFRLRTGDTELRKFISAPLTRKDIARFRSESYRLQTPDQPILDQTILDRMAEFDAELSKVEMKDEWSRPVKRAIVDEPAVERTPVIIGKVPVVPFKTLRITGEISDRLDHTYRKVPSVPSIALQVGIFHKESQALKARKKIMSKLYLPVTIVKQWDYYHVLVTGFHTREETYQYYPELAGLGYPGITLIENYRGQ